MSEWVKEENQAENTHGSIAAAVAAAAAEVTALSEYAFVPELGVHFDRSSGYAFKEGCHDFHHASTHYTYHFDESSSSWQCSYEPEWDRSVGCPASLDAFVLLSELVDRIEIESDPIADGASSPAALSVDQEDERPPSTDEMLPCIRAIVLESDELPYGHLSIITVDGGAISCDKSREDYSGPMPVCGESEKGVCHIRFDAETKRFLVEKVLTEGGDEEGELVDDEAVSVIVNETVLGKNAVEISHQDKLVVDCGEDGFVVLSLHVHKALNTCAGCEPGLLMSSWSTGESATTTESTDSKSKRELERDRRREVKRIKKKYALSRIDYVDKATDKAKNSDKYTDRADIRRRTVGSDLPDSATEAIASREAASSSKPVKEDNRGFKMLKKMGWKEGSGVGKREDGIQDPICPVGQMDSSGLGANTSTRMAVGDAHLAQKRFKWSKAAQRYAKLEKNAVFENADV